jgi:cytochrome c oxidase assembly protein subunit 15
MSTPEPIRAAPDLTLLKGTLMAPAPRGVRIWLFAVASLCLVIAVVGAVTRLTESGLSMTEWKPLLQDIPPFSRAAWERLFALYQQSPQYRLVNQGMTLAEYQDIFWWEWAHRLIAQLIGVVFALPFLWFLARRQLPRRLIPYLVGLFALGALQGLVGWLMVASGLNDRPSVSHYRLAAHLTLALTVYSLTLWTAFFVSRPRAEAVAPPALRPAIRRHAAIGLGTLAVTMVWGAFTAGLRAGLLYNTFPMMGGSIAPPDALALTPWWSNALENPSTVQFIHRMLAMTTGLVLLALALRLRAPAMALELRRTATAIFVTVALQIFLGVETVLNHVPIWLAALHQANAILLLGIMVRTIFLLRPVKIRQFKPTLIVTGRAA